MVQEHCMAKYNASIEELLYHCYLGSTGISFLLALTSGELVQGISFLVNGPNGSIGTWVSQQGTEKVEEKNNNIISQN